MQTCPCPRCGAALALSLASLHGVRCRSCGYEGPPRPEVLERLRIAQGELSRLDQRTRQLDASAQAAIGRALRTRWGAIVVLSLGVLPFVALAVAGVAEGFEAHPGLPLANRIIGVSLTWVPLLVYACVGGILAAFVGRARRRLLAASAAIPPERPGEPVTCAVCGASLASFGTSPIARCGYCAADNVVHPAALRQAATARSFDIDSIGATTALRAREVVSAASHASAMGVASVVGTPPVSFFAVLALLLFAKAVEPYIALAASPTPRYAWVATKRGKCVGLIGERDGVPQAHFGGNDKLPNPMTLDTLPPRFAPSAIVGRTMRLANGKRGRVVGVTGAPVTNREQLVLDSGAHGDLPGACAEE